MPPKLSKVAFTGFRDAELQRKIEAQGGRVVSTVSSDTDVLVMAGAAGATSKKAKQARTLGVAVMQKDEFVKRYFPEGGWWTKLFKSSSGSADKATPRPKTSRRRDDTCYTTLDNGGPAFKVCASSTKFWVFAPNPDSIDAGREVYDRLALPPTPYTRMFVGKSPRNAMTEYSGGHGPKYDGNSMLFKLGDGSYVHVGDCVKAFRAAPGDAVERYVSPVGNSGVPYPYAVGDKYHYLLLEDKRVPNVALKAGEDPYDFYYNYDCVRQCSGCAADKPCRQKKGCLPSCRAETDQRNRAIGVKSMHVRTVHKALF